MYIIFNETDGVFAFDRGFKTKKEAEVMCESFRKRFDFQGYYLTSNRGRISPKDVKLKIIKRR